MEKNKKFVSPLFQIIAFSVASLCLVALFYKPFVDFRSHDQVPALMAYEKQNSLIPVQMGLTIHHFMESDIIKNTVSIDATVWFGYDPKTVTREQIGQFSFDEATLEKLQPTYAQNGPLEIASYDIQVHCKMDFNFKEYPLDDHRLWFSLKNGALPAEKYQFIVPVDAFVLACRAQIKNCRAENIVAHSGLVSQKLTLLDGQHELRASRALFSIDCNPIDMRHFLNIFLPMFLIFFLTLFSFSFGYSEHFTDVPSIAAASVPALFAYRFVIESVSPDVSYFMMSDYLFFLYLMLSLATFLCVAWALNYSAHIKKLIIIGLYAVMLIGCAGIVYFF